MADLNLIEKIGLEILRRRIDRNASHIREWSRSELAEIERIEFRTKIVAALAGALSGALLGIIEIWLGESALDFTTVAAWRAQLPDWTLYVALAVLISGAEVVYLYGYALRAVARISSVAGLSLSAHEIEDLIARGLARAALEIPNPREPIYGMDPYARVPRWKLIAYTVLYRLKVGATSFIVRVLLQRVLSRTAFRVFVPLAALPVFAIWNALIARWVVREVRIRVTGPLVVQQLGERIAAARASLDQRARRIILGVVGEVIVRGEDAHPNYVLLLERLFAELDLDPEPVRPDWPASCKALMQLSPQVQNLVLAILTVAAVLNSRLRKAQRELIEEAFRRCNRTLRPDAIPSLRQQILEGKGINEEQLRRLGLD